MSDSAPSIKPLKLGGFNDWDIDIRAYLQSKGLWRLVAGTKTKPAAVTLNATATNQDLVTAADAARDKWDDQDEKAVGIIVTTLSHGERTALATYLDGRAPALYAAIRARHVQVKPLMCKSCRGE